MAIKLDDTNVTSVSLDSEEVKKIILDSATVWCKPYTFTLTKQSNVASVSLSRSSTSEPTASTGTLLSNAGTATIYYEDKITASATASTGYHFGTDQSKTTDSYTNNLVSANVSWGPTVNINTYAVYIAAGLGISSVYLSTTASATSGSASGTKFNYGSTVYGFAVLGEHYDVPDGWVLISGTRHETGSKYRVATKTNLTSAHDFGTINANIETYTLTITKGTGVDKIYYKVNGASSYTSSTSTVSVSVNDLSTYYYYATASTGYTADANCGSSSLPITGTVSCEDINKSVTATINTYTITWKYLSAYPDTWTTTTESYNYGATPSRTAPSTVTSGNNRKVFANWDDLSVVTSSRTITAVYTQQYYATISPSYCTANRATGWYNSGTVITWTANDNYSFGGSAVKDTTTTTISSGTTYSKSPGYVKCTISGTRCSANKTSGSILAVGTTITWTASTSCAFNSAGTTTTATASVALGATSYSKSADYIYVTVSGTNCTANKSTGWFAYNTQCTWTASTNYAFNSSGTTTSTANFTSAGATYSKSPEYGKYTVSCMDCTADVSTGWYAVTTSKSTTFTANAGWSFGGATLQDTKTVSAPVPGSVIAIPGYCNITVSATNCTANVASGIVKDLTTVITYTASTNYAFDSSGTTTSTLTVSGPGTYSKSPGYGKYTVTATNSTANVSTGWYAVTSSKSTTFTANSGWSFGGTTAQDTTTKSAAVPGSVSASPSYFYVTIQATNCSANKSTAWYNASFTCTWTASTNYAFNNTGTTTSAQTISSPGTYSKSPGYGKYTLSLTNCVYNSGNNTGWYTLGTKPSTTVKANSSWSFGGTTAQDTTTIGGTNAVPTTVSASPSYFYLTISAGTGCTANKSSGFYNAAQTITWTRSTGYAFDSSGTTTASQTTSAAPGSYSKSPTHGYYTLSLTNCAYNSGNNAGWYTLGTKPSTVVKASSGWSFGGSTAQDTTSIGGTNAVPTTVSASPSYFYITVSAGTGCTVNKSSGFYTSSTKPSSITWTPKTYYSFDAGDTQTSYTNSSISSAPATYTAKPMNFKAASIETSYCTADKDSSTYYAAGTMITWTAGDVYSFGGSTVGDTITTGPITAGQTFGATPGYVKCTIEATNCEASETSDSILADGTIITFTAKSNFAFDNSGTTVVYRTVTLDNYQPVASAQYIYVNIQAGTGCTVNKPIGWNWIRALTEAITWTPNTNYSFHSSGSSTTKTQVAITPGATYTQTPGYGYLNISAYHCSGTSSGWYGVGYKNLWMTADSGWAFDENGSTTSSRTVTVPGTYYYPANYKVLNALIVHSFASNEVTFTNPSSNPAVKITATYRGTGQTVPYLSGQTIQPNNGAWLGPDRSDWVDYSIAAYGTCELYTRSSGSVWVDPYIEPDEG